MKSLLVLSLSFLSILSTQFIQKSYAGTTTVKVDGSSTVMPITEAMAEEFQKEQKGAVNVTVGVSGTGGGFKKFCRGETDVQDASRPISEKEMVDCKSAQIKYVELPIAFDAIVIVVNPKNNWIKDISIEQLKKIWEPGAQSKIMKWSQIAPKQTDVKWPDQKINLYGAGSDSGTFDYFTEAVVGKAKSSRGDYTASEDDNTLVQGISNDKFALGYLPLSYYEANKSKLKVLGIIGKSAKPVLPSKETVVNGSYEPFSRPLFIYVSEASLKKSEVKKFTEFYLAKAELFVPEVKYIALPAEAYKMANERVQKNKLGTSFSGHSKVGMKIEEILKKEPLL
jgi:phosphate transport system substrate-binding protein